MKSITILGKIVSGLWVLFLSSQLISAQTQVLVSGTDFSCAGKETEAFTDVTAITGYLGFIKPSITMNVPVASSCDFDETSSDFVDGKYYAITNNPTKLDSFRLYDNSESYWGMALPLYSGNENIMKFSVGGLAAGDYTVEVEYCFMASYSKPTFPNYDCGYPGVQYQNGAAQYGSIDPKIKIVANPDQYNTLNGADMGFSNAEKTSHGCHTATLISTSSNCGVIGSDGNLTVYINSSSQTSGLFLKSIKVYGLVEAKIAGVEEVCAGGEKGIISVSGTYNGATYKWYKDGVLVPGETGKNLSHTSGTSTGSTDYYYIMTVPDGKGGTADIKSAVHTVKDIVCCSDPVSGEPQSRKLIWKNDFGTFESATSFYVWDYSDLSEPKKVYYTTTKNYRYNLPQIGIPAPDGAQGTDIMSADAHEVCAYITDDASGANIGWAAQCGNGEYYGAGRAAGSFFPDHTDQIEGTGKMGACLFVNAAKGDHTSSPLNIYKEDIKGLCDHTHLTVKCYINNFSNGANPVQVKIHVYDTDNPSVEAWSSLITRYADGLSGTAWVEVSVDIDEITSNNLTFEILDYSENSNDQGDDLLLDDVMVYACSAPSVYLYFDLPSHAQDTITCEGDDVSLFVDESTMLTSFYSSNLAYLYQYNITDPDDADFKKNWINLTSAALTANSYEKKINTVIEDIKNLYPAGNYPQVFFRVVAGNESAINSRISSTNYFNPDDPCSDMSISKPIELTIDCPKCTEPKDPQIKAIGGKVTARRVDLCPGESTVLSSNDITSLDKNGDPYTDYSISWYKETASSTVLKPSSSPAVTADPLTVSYADAAETGTEYILRIHDNFENTSGTAVCDKYDTIVVYANPEPKPYEISDMNFCENSTIIPVLSDSVTLVEGSLYTLNWSSPITTTPNLSTLTAPASVSYSYTVTDNLTGCESAEVSFLVTVNAKPVETLTAPDPFCAYVSGVASTSPEAKTLPALPTSTTNTVKWYSDAAATLSATTTDLSKLAGSLTPYTYYYTVTDANGCVSDVASIEITAQPTATVSIKQTNVCDLTTLTATADPVTGSILWSSSETTASIQITDKTKVGNYSVSVSATGYCKSSEVDTTAYLYESPSSLTTQTTQYLKTESPFKSILAQNPAAVTGQATGATLMWSSQLKLSGMPSTGYSAGEPIPTAADLTGTADETYYYYLFQQTVNSDGSTCQSDTVELIVKILGAPAPNVRDTVYCLNEKAAAITDHVSVNQADASKIYKLLWYDDNGVSISQPTISTATVGKQTYQVSQIEDGSSNESSKMPVVIEVYGVEKPSVVDIPYCLGDLATSLSATTVDDGNYMRTDGNKWYNADGSLYGTTAPVPSTATAGETIYQVSQTYKITSGQICESDKADIKVTVNETTEPGDHSFAYVAAEVGASNQFADISSKGWIEETGYTYYYYNAGQTQGTAPTDLTQYTTTVPAPNYDVSTLNGGSVDLYYYVYRVNTATSCASTVSLITVTISDALPPIVKDYVYCEGTTVQDLTVEKNIQSGKSDSDYEILWYGTTKPASTTSLSETTGLSYPMNSVSAAVTGGTVTTTSYWVAQKDLQTTAVSAAQEIKVIVYPKPIVLTTDPLAVCEVSVDLASTWKVSNSTEAQTATYYNADGSVMTASSVLASGTYSISSEYTIPVGNASATNVVDNVCKGVAENVTVTINDLTVPKIDGPISVCPGKTVSLTASATSKDPGTVSYQWGGDATGNQDTYTSSNLSTETGTTYSHMVTATAGACSKTIASPFVVTVGDGPVEGTMTVTEADNADAPKVFTDDMVREFYSCGGALTLTVAYTNTGLDDYVWYDGTSQIATGATLNIPATTTAATKTYTLKYTNDCEATAEITVHTIPLTVTPTETKLETMCEGSEFSTGINIECDETPTIKWFREGNEISGSNASTYTIAKVKDADDGQYSYEVTNRGCKATGDAASLDAQPYIQVTNQTDPYIVPRNGNQSISLNITVPTSGTVDKVDWKENGSSVFTGNPYSVTGVVSDHTYSIELTDPDYCSATTTATIWVDAELQLSATLTDTMCYGETKVLTIDTTGTGAFRQSGVAVILNVTETAGGSTIDLTSKIKKNGLNLEVQLSPTETSTYLITFEYGSQKKSWTQRMVVLQPIKLTVPTTPTICEGEEATLEVTNISPEGTTISWNSDPTITSSLTGETVTVAPTYQGSASGSHQSMYTYTFVANFPRCETKSFTASVKVDEPLSGEIVGDSIICEGKSSRLDASAYDATSYTWSEAVSTGDSIVGYGSMITVKPAETTTYTLLLGRGACKATASYNLEVSPTPVILSIDSVNIRDRRVIADETIGKQPFLYWVDSHVELATPDELLADLSFSSHVAHLKDSLGCETSYPFAIDAPAVTIPEYFTPNADGVNDTWKVPMLADIYPASVVKIYDRYGKLLTEFLGGDADGWNGSYNGNSMPSTDYWYVIDIEEIDKQYVGHFTLIRQ